MLNHRTRSQVRYEDTDKLMLSLALLLLGGAKWMDSFVTLARKLTTKWGQL